MEKSFEPAQIESTWYARWEASGAFEPSGKGGRTASCCRRRCHRHLAHGPRVPATVMDMLVRYEACAG
ncbi:Valine--tRNA ligase OS=Rhodanobacter lindaniclasticus OX=75310 GN=valS PE=3 SV=1 [Rhodanobacter lindaniclasticus]